MTKSGRTQIEAGKRLESAREALRAFSRLERKNCLAYEFVALKLGCSKNQAADLVSEVYRAEEAAKEVRGKSE